MWEILDSLIRHCMHWQINGGGGGCAPYGPKIPQFHAVNLAISYVGPPRTVGAPFYGESWNRPWHGLTYPPLRIYPPCPPGTSSGSSGRIGGGRQETWNLCGHLRRPSFLWLIFTGPGGGGIAPSAPHGSATVEPYSPERTRDQPSQKGSGSRHPSLPPPPRGHETPCRQTDTSELRWGR